MPTMLQLPRLAISSVLYSPMLSRGQTLLSAIGCCQCFLATQGSVADSWSCVSGCNEVLRRQIPKEEILLVPPWSSARVAAKLLFGGNARRDLPQVISWAALGPRRNHLQTGIDPTHKFRRRLVTSGSNLQCRARACGVRVQPANGTPQPAVRRRSKADPWIASPCEQRACRVNSRMCSSRTPVNR